MGLGGLTGAMVLELTPAALSGVLQKGSVILSYPILSYPILSYPILSYPILSYPILSNPIQSSSPPPQKSWRRSSAAQGCWAAVPGRPTGRVDTGPGAWVEGAQSRQEAEAPAAAGPQRRTVSCLASRMHGCDHKGASCLLQDLRGRGSGQGAPPPTERMNSPKSQASGTGAPSQSHRRAARASSWTCGGKASAGGGARRGAKAEVFRGRGCGAAARTGQKFGDPAHRPSALALPPAPGLA
jgi:hypothetical protein